MGTCHPPPSTSRARHHGQAPPLLHPHRHRPPSADGTSPGAKPCPHRSSLAVAPLHTPAALRAQSEQTVPAKVRREVVGDRVSVAEATASHVLGRPPHRLLPHPTHDAAAATASANAGLVLEHEVDQLAGAFLKAWARARRVTHCTANARVRGVIVGNVHGRRAGGGGAASTPTAPARKWPASSQEWSGRFPCAAP